MHAIKLDVNSFVCNLAGEEIFFTAAGGGREEARRGSAGAC